MYDNWQSQLTAIEKETYLDLFTKVDVENNGIVFHDQVMELLKNYNITQTKLNEFWTITDTVNKRYLTKQEFCMILKRIACTQHNVTVGDLILATKVPLPEFNKPTSNPDTITPEQRQKHLRMFKSLNVEILDGDKAKEVFQKSRLPLLTLQKIWDLADVRISGTLNQTEFIIAMFYIERAMEGFDDFPTALPTATYASAIDVSSIDITIPSMITPEEYKESQTIFNKIDINQTGFISGPDAVVFFQHSNLPVLDLARIWELADEDVNGMLSEREFAIAMHLIKKKMLDNKQLHVSEEIEAQKKILNKIKAETEEAERLLQKYRQEATRIEEERKNDVPKKVIKFFQL